MKKLLKIFIVINLLGILLLTQNSLVSSYLILPDPQNGLPSIETDKNIYFPNEEINITADWWLYIEDGEIVNIYIIILDYNPESTSWNLALSDAISRNNSITCPNPSNNVPTVYNTLFSCQNLNLENSTAFWVSLLIISYKNDIPVEHCIENSPIQINRYSIDFESPFPENYQIDYNNSISFNNSIFAFENNSIIYSAENILFSIYEENVSIFSKLLNSDDSGYFTLSLSNDEFNKTGNFQYIFNFQENFLFNSKIINGDLTIFPKNLSISCPNKSLYLMDPNIQSYNLDLLIFDEGQNEIELDDILWDYSTNLNNSYIYNSENDYFFHFSAPSSSGSYFVKLFPMKYGFYFENYTKNLEFKQNTFNFTLRFRDMKINESLSLYIERESNFNFSSGIIEKLKLITSENTTLWYDINYTLEGNYDTVLIIEIEWDKLIQKINFQDNELFYFKISFLGDLFFLPENSSVLSINRPLFANFTANTTMSIEFQKIQFFFCGYTGIEPTSFLWNFGDGIGTSTEQNPVYFYNQSGSFSISLTIIDLSMNNNSIIKKNFIQVEKNYVPFSNFTVNSTKIVLGEKLLFNFTGSLGNEPTSLIWDLGNGDSRSNQSFIYLYNITGSFNVSLSIMDIDGEISIIAQIEIDVENNILPVADFILEKNNIVLGDIIQILFCGSEGNGPASFFWDFGDGIGTSTDRNPLYRYSNSGNYNISLNLTDRDKQKSYFMMYNAINVEIELKPAADFCIKSNSLLIVGEKVDFQFNGTEGNGIDEILWRVDGILKSSEEEFIYKFDTYGNHEVTLQIQDIDGDISIYSQILKIQSDLIPKANFTFSPCNPSQYIAGNLFNFSFSGSLGNNPSNFFWDFGDGTNSTLMNPNHKFLLNGTFNSKLIITDIDNDSSEISCMITILEDIIPLSNFVCNNSKIISGQYVQFSFCGSEGNGPASFFWDFGDNFFSNEKDPIHQYLNTGNYTVILRVEDIDNEQFDELKKNRLIIVENSIPIADFIINSTNSIQGDLIQFLFIGNEGNGPASFFWDFGDGTNSSIKSPHHIFQSDGFFNITLTIQDINEDLRKVSKLVFISKNFEPIASFSIISNDYIIGQKIDFTFTGEEGNGPASFFWDFGDGTNSTLMNPNHTYKSLGNFSISLCVRDQNGDENMCFKQDFIEILLDFQPIANYSFYIINQHSDYLVEINFTGEVGNGPASFFWDFGDGTNSTLMNPNHTYTSSGKFQIKLTIIDKDGDTSQLFKNIELGKSHALFQTLIFSITSVSFASGGIILFRKRRNKKTSIPLALLKI